MRTQRRVRLISGLTALLAAVGLVVLPPSGGAGQARAAEAEDSAFTAPGRAGRYDDFSDLRVTVHQTRGLRGQGVRISWTGGKQTKGSFESNFLQIMQCWGDDPSGPRREQCQFGKIQAMPDGIRNRGLASSLVGFQSGEAQFDPDENEYPFAPAPGDPTQGEKGWVPFRPVSGAPTTGPNDHTYFTQFTTNEQPFLSTGPDGTGEAVFEVQTALESDHLGCGAVEGAAARSCWLVVVPRGEHDANGQLAGNNGLASSPLSASNWANRITVKLEFEPIGASCPLDLRVRPVYGSEILAEATGSWQAALCESKDVSFNHIRQGEEAARGQVGTGLGLTIAPVEASEDSDKVVHAPMAVSGLVIGYNVEFPRSSKQLPRLRLNARLVAKLLTSSYHHDLPGQGAQRGDLPKENPRTLRHDPEFLELNPEFRQGWPPELNMPAGIMVPQGNSDYARMLWRWLQNDKHAREFLSGKEDPWGAKVNSHFLALHLEKDDAISDFPKADPVSYAPDPRCPEMKVDLIDYRPYTASLHDSGLRARKGYNGQKAGADCSSDPRKLTGDAQPAGERFQLALVDAATAARYGLGTAELRNADGDWVKPGTTSFNKAVAGMKKGPEGVLDQDPTLRTEGAYPFTTVIYGAASTGLGAELRRDYADLIRYAAEPGQQPGIEPGKLPPGYAPLTGELRSQALEAADELAEAQPGETAGASSGSSEGGSSGGGGTSGGDAAATGGAASGGPEGGASGESDSGTTASPAPGGAADGSSKDTVARTGPLTPEKILGIIRWVLLATLIAGIVGAVAGPVLLRVGSMRAAGAPGSHLEGNSSVPQGGIR
ncbi:MULTISPECIES: hypothetical protein [Streptomyces]|uniref:Uncharacterized protein n=1 Tax=Streptomyces pratisoli TaxID=3139917 RepID=A0ACC6QM41_9ACTN|nr:hypothetical protein [Streptomyces sp. NBC_00259]